MESNLVSYPEAHPSRNYGVDLLRILAMLMVTVMHAQVHGNVIFGPADIGLNYYLCWIVQALCEVATDCFFLISGYYLINQPASYGKAATLWGTVLFYSWGIFLLLLPFGLVDLSHSPLLGSLLPITTNNYWFMTCYLALYFLSPYLNLSLHAMTEKQMRSLVIVLLVLLSVWPVLTPMVMTFEHHGGIGITWSIAVYVFAAYFRLHVTKLPNRWVCLGVYLGASALALILRFVFTHFGHGGYPFLLDYANTILTYNSPLTFAAATALFLFFVQLRVERPLFQRIIHFIAPTVLASYLITEQHNMMDYLWTQWIPTRAVAANWWFIPYLFAVALLILLASCLIDRVRRQLFLLIARCFRALRVKR